MSSIRRVAGVAALALVSTALTATGVVTAVSPASAADAAAFNWAISQQYVDHLSTRELSGGATEADGAFSFPATSSDIDEATGAGTASYHGSVSGSFAFGGTTYYTVTLADPTVTVDADGEGEISAVVSASNAAGMGSEAESTEPARVVVTTFDAESGWTDGVLAATPRWEGVLPPGEEATALGADEGEPVDGKSFAPSFLGQITSGVRAHFWASGATSDPKKAPAEFTAVAGAAAEPAVTAATSYSAKNVTIAVEGTGFTGVTNPGDDGVYVALAPAAKFPETDDFEDQEKVADAEWVTAAQLADGTFSVVLDPASAHLRPGTKYAVYTWQAHAHSNPSQDTRTPVKIDFAKVGKATKLKAAKKGKQLVVTVGKRAVGKVVVKLTKGKAAKKVSSKVKAKTGKAAVKLPAAKGTWKAKVTFKPAKANYRAAKKTFTVRVR